MTIEREELESMIAAAVAKAVAEMPVPKLVTGKCDSCDGSGDGSQYSRDRYCGTCDGSGLELTDFGQSVVNVIGRHFSSMLRDRMN